MTSVEMNSRGTNKTLPIVGWVSCLLGGWIIGLILAYVDRSRTNGLYASHYQYLIRTVWIGLLFCAVSFVLSFVAIGLLTFAATSLWYMVRCVKGLVLAIREEPIANPGTWLV
jgi:uncharacterized membrane protein